MNEKSAWKPGEIWRPGELWLADSNFEVIMNPRFAESMLASKFATPALDMLNQEGGELVAKSGYSAQVPFVMLNGTALMDELSLGKDQSWLRLDGNSRFYLSLPPCRADNVVYTALGVNRCQDKDTLMALFSLYLEHVNRIK